MMRPRLLLLCFLCCIAAKAQSAWPSENWTSAAPLTTIMDTDGLLDLSGMHWNPQNNRLYLVQGDGRLRVLQLNTSTNLFTQIGSKSIAGGPEGITQANLSANQFYTIDENNYEIRKYTHSANFSTVTESRHWNLLQSPSPMQDTGNNGPEGIVFAPDANLAAAGFISPLDGSPYTSVKGAGGLFFVAHQDGGYIWIFDINPTVTNDFAYVGKIKTSRAESCDISFDRSTGLLYILHNVGANYLEVCELTTVVDTTIDEPRFHTVSEYFLSNPSDGNINIEGFALMPKCDATVTGAAFLCRDVESNEDAAVQQDAIRWFDPFLADGICAPLSTKIFEKETVTVYPNPSNQQITVHFSRKQKRSVEVYDMLGQKKLHFITTEAAETFDVSDWASGIYLLEVTSDCGTVSERIVKD